ncbi:hypothetical protein [Burkholderia cepacia]|uniref:hypothetical protein n=1 Tax=Burkholderia cepacia TaxID=292 RepID=UPI003528E173
MDDARLVSIRRGNSPPEFVRIARSPESIAARRLDVFLHITSGFLIDWLVSPPVLESDADRERIPAVKPAYLGPRERRIQSIGIEWKM